MEIPTRIYNKYRCSWQEGEPQLARDVGNEFDEAFEDDLASEQTDFWRLKEACWISWDPKLFNANWANAKTHMANSGTICLNSFPKLLYQSWFPYCRIFLNKEQMFWSFPHAMSKLMTRRNIVQLEIQPIRSAIYNHGWTSTFQRCALVLRAFENCEGCHTVCVCHIFRHCDCLNTYTINQNHT